MYLLYTNVYTDYKGRRKILFDPTGPREGLLVGGKDGQ
jgi:hypothetical protein